MCTGFRSPTPIDVPRLMSRRGFLRAGAATAVVASSTLLRPRTAHATDAGCVPETGISIQLYTMRDVMAEDLDATFAALADIGYRQVEHAGFGATESGTAAEFRAALDRHGLQSTSGHQGIPYPFDEGTWQQRIDDAVTVGQRSIVEPMPAFVLAGFITDIIVDGAGLDSVAHPAPSAVWADYAATMNRAAEMAAEHGLAVGYHNHNPEFLPLPDDPSRTGYDVLLAETDPELVHFELDLYWAWAGETDPVELLEAHPGRFRRFHVKDMAEDGSITAPGRGIIDFRRIFAAAERLGVPIAEWIIEQDNAGQDAVQSARLGYELLAGTCAAPDAAPAAPSAPEQAPGPGPSSVPTTSSLPATGGGAAALGALGLAAALRLRRGDRHV